MRFASSILVALLTVSGFAQAEKPVVVAPNLELYKVALVEASNELERQYGHFKEDQFAYAVDYKHLIVCSDESVSEEFPIEVDGQSFEYLSKEALLSRRQTSKKDFRVLIVNPAKIDGSKLKVVVEQRSVTFYDNNPALSISDWAAVFFRFDCVQNRFVLDSVKVGGI